MCGIVAYIGKKEAYPIVLKGLKRLEYRGYDSSGIALLKNEEIKLFKKEGKVLNLENHVESKDNSGQEGSDIRVGRLMVHRMIKMPTLTFHRMALLL
jgi:glucosamine--fructose-6-phosphate aminotransferase (isomerizing)